MAGGIGTLTVELGVNLASYFGGMDSASAKAKALSRDIKDSFESFGGAISGVLGQFGEVGEVAERSFDQAITWAGKLAPSLSSLGPILGGIATGAVAAGAALAAAGVSGLALASHASESAAHLAVLAQATGVSTETLSRFHYVAQQTGVDSDAMDKALIRLSRSAFAAATAPEGTTNAYTRLGLSVKDTTGQLKAPEVLFGEIADKLSKMSDGAAKTAEVTALLGARGGAQLAAALNLGSDGIKRLSDESDAFGNTISGQTAEAAHVFQQSLEKIQTAGTGLTNQLMIQLLPSLQLVASQFVDALKDPDSSLRAMITVVGYLGQAILALGELVVTVFKEASDVIWGTIATLQEAGNTLKGEFNAALHLDWDGFVAAGQAGGRNMVKVWKGALGDMKDDATDFTSKITKIFSGASAPVGPAEKRGGGPGPDLTPATRGKQAEVLAAEIAKLHQEAEAQLATASASGQSAAALLLRKAAAEADTTISELHAKAVDKEGKPIATLNAVIDANAAKIREWAQVKAAAAEVGSFGKKVSDETSKLNEESGALVTMAAAFGQGGAAIENAKVSQALAADRAELSSLNEMYRILVQLFGAANPMVKEFKTDLDGATDAVKKHAEAIKQNDIAKLNEALKEATFNLRTEAEAWDITSAAAFKSSGAQRQAAANAAAIKFGGANPGASEEQLAQVYSNALKSQQMQLQQQILSSSAQEDLNKKLDDELTRLGQIKAALIANGQSTLLVDKQILDAQKQIETEWNAAALASDKFGKTVAGVLNTIKLQGQGVGQSIADSFLKATDSLESELSKLVTGQGSKGGFKQIGQQLEENITGTFVKSGVSKLAGGLLGATGLSKMIPGLNGKSTGQADGSQANPFFVSIIDPTTGQAAGSGFGGSNNGGDLLSKLFHFGVGNSSQGVQGGFGFGSILKSIFGGFLAGGGDVTPGKAYVVGENHPELFLPSSPGRIVPNFSGAPHQSQTTVHLHVHGVTDADSFKKSATQITGMLGSAAQRAQQRLGR